MTHTHHPIGQALPILFCANEPPLLFQVGVELLEVLLGQLAQRNLAQLRDDMLIDGIVNGAIRASLGFLFTWKSCILIGIVILSVFFYRPFCKWFCPLGAFYALFNRVSLFQMKVDKNKCVSCGKCARACKMDVDVTKTPNHTECIRCGMCVRACPTKAVCFRYGFGSGKETTKKTTMEESK